MNNNSLQSNLTKCLETFNSKFEYAKNRLDQNNNNNNNNNNDSSDQIMQTPNKLNHPKCILNFLRLIKLKTESGAYDSFENLVPVKFLNELDLHYEEKECDCGIELAAAAATTTTTMDDAIERNFTLVSKICHRTTVTKLPQLLIYYNVKNATTKRFNSLLLEKSYLKFNEIPEKTLRIALMESEAEIEAVHAEISSCEERERKDTLKQKIETLIRRKNKIAHAYRSLITDFCEKEFQPKWELNIKRVMTQFWQEKAKIQAANKNYNKEEEEEAENIKMKHLFQKSIIRNPIEAKNSVIEFSPMQDPAKYVKCSQEEMRNFMSPQSSFFKYLTPTSNNNNNNTIPFIPPKTPNSPVLPEDEDDKEFILPVLSKQGIAVAFQGFLVKVFNRHFVLVIYNGSSTTHITKWFICLFDFVDNNYRTFSFRETDQFILFWQDLIEIWQLMEHQIIENNEESINQMSIYCLWKPQIV
jgi:hypothetical protein